MSFLAWIDFDHADRTRARQIMDLFAEKDTRDELGLGSALADLMFPGTSTIQTRLRYGQIAPHRDSPADTPIVGLARKLCKHALNKVAHISDAEAALLQQRFG